jgi:hypothetical protein
MAGSGEKRINGSAAGALAPEVVVIHDRPVAPIGDRDEADIAEEELGVTQPRD